MNGDFPRILNIPVNFLHLRISSGSASIILRSRQDDPAGTFVPASQASTVFFGNDQDTGDIVTVRARSFFGYCRCFSINLYNQRVEKVKYATPILFAGGIFQRVSEFISATRFLRSRSSGGIFLPLFVEKAQRSGFFDSLYNFTILSL
jgi:hypothetical protein